MFIVDIIIKKKNKLELSKEEINFFVENINNIEKCQISALMMAICLNGLTDDEIVNLTIAMANSGDKLDLSPLTNCVDKHSTGGVGDKVSLIAGPIVASLGCTVCKMSGGALGYTGGTIDKLLSLDMKTSLTEDEFLKQANEINLCIMSQTKDIAPADKVMYAIRDITGTVESLGLIAASIMSKKIASGAKNLVIDVKIGSGAFMKDVNSGRELAMMMKRIGNLCGINTVCILSNMDVPLGYCVGNRLEVKETLDILSNKGNQNLLEVSTIVATNMVATTLNISIEDAKNKVLEVIENETALNKFKDFVEYQKGDISLSNKQALNKLEVYATSEGYIATIDALTIGNISCKLGAGKVKLDDVIDYDAGVVLNVGVNDYVKEGDLLATLYSNNTINITEEEFDRAIMYSDKEVNSKLIYDII